MKTPTRLNFFLCTLCTQTHFGGEKSDDLNSLANLVGRTLKVGEEIFEDMDKVSILNSNIRWLF
jgi:hypothetical protein